MGQFLADALWSDLKLGVLARSRNAHDACAALHAQGDVAALVAAARDAFEAREDNYKDALEHVWTQVNRRDLRREFDERAKGRRPEFLLWLYDLALREAKPLANSRFFLDPPFPDRVWVQRGTTWDLAWFHDGKWSLKSLKEVRAAKVAPLETLLTVRVAGVERLNPRLPAP